MLLKHHALDVNDNDDEDVKNCVDASIKNSNEATPEESEMEETPVTNRANAEALEAANAKIAELEKKLKEAPQPLHNRRTARTPDAIIEDGQENAEELERLEKISNRASELEKSGVPSITAYNRASAQFPPKTTK